MLRVFLFAMAALTIAVCDPGRSTYNTAFVEPVLRRRAGRLPKRRMASRRPPPLPQRPQYRTSRRALVRYRAVRVRAGWRSVGQSGGQRHSNRRSGQDLYARSDRAACRPPDRPPAPGPRGRRDNASAHRARFCRACPGFLNRRDGNSVSRPGAGTGRGRYHGTNREFRACA